MLSPSSYHHHHHDHHLVSTSPKSSSEQFYLLGYNAVKSIEKLKDVSEKYDSSIFRVEE
jgi:hypothetical protein